MHDRCHDRLIDVKSYDVIAFDSVYVLECKLKVLCAQN